MNTIQEATFDLSVQAQQLADYLHDALRYNAVPNSRELWTAFELLQSGAAHLRGAAAQLHAEEARHIDAVQRAADKDELLSAIMEANQ